MVKHLRQKDLKFWKDLKDPNHHMRFLVGHPRTGGYGLTFEYSSNYDILF